MEWLTDPTIWLGLAGKSLPIWRDLPPITYWLLPSAVGVPLIVWALSRYQNVIAYAGALSASGLAAQTKTNSSRRRLGTSVSGARTREIDRRHQSG